MTADAQIELAKALAKACDEYWDSLPDHARGFWLFEAKCWREDIARRAGKVDYFAEPEAR